MASKILIQGKYELIGMINKSLFSKIYKAKNIYKDNYVVIKFDSDELSKRLIYNEINIYLDLLKKKNTSFVNIKTFGKIDNKNYIIMDYIPYTIEDYVNMNNNKLNSKVILGQLIEMINQFHSHGYVHRDIKPDNILVKNNQLYLIDFGLATKKTNHKYNNFIGNKLFSSFEVHMHEYEYRKIDDIISCYFIVFYLFSDKLLPWKNVYINNKIKEKEILYNLKKYSDFDKFYKKYNLADIIFEYKTVVN